MIEWVSDRTEPTVRKGKTMKQANADSAKTIKRQFDHQGNSMPAADTAECLALSYSIKAGLSGYPDPDALMRILE